MNKPPPKEKQPDPRRAFSINRNNPVGQSEESEEWIVSYMDMVTLLMIVFLTLVGFMWVDKKTRPTVINVVPEASGQAAANWRPVNQDTARSLAELPVNDPASPSEKPISDKPQRMLPAGVEVAEETLAAAEVWANAVRRANIEDQVKVVVQQHRVTLEIRDRILFGSGQAEISYDGQPVLQRLATMLRGMPGVISVEGHSDNVPLKGGRFGSNWELSSARAGAVVRAMVEGGIRPDRVRVVAYADTKPLADNRTPEGRAANRRVSIVVEEQRAVR